MTQELLPLYLSLIPTPPTQASGVSSHRHCSCTFLRGTWRDGANKTPAILAAVWEVGAALEGKPRAELRGHVDSHLPEVTNVLGFPQKMVKGSLEPSFTPTPAA